MVDPDELLRLYADFLSEAKFEFEDMDHYGIWCMGNTEFLKWLAEENRIRAQLEEVKPGSFDHFRRLLSANA